MSEAPKFKKIGLSFTSEAIQKQEEERAKPRESTFLDEPGVYDVEIDSVSVSKFPSEDPTWKNMEFKLKAANGKTTTAYVKIPTEHEWYERVSDPVSGETQKIMGPMMHFKMFACALGLDDADEAVYRLLNTSMTGTRLRVELAYPYKTLHLNYINGGYVVVDNNNVAYPLAGGRVFSKKNEAELWAAQQKPPVRFRFLEVRKYMPPVQPNRFLPIEGAEAVVNETSAPATAVATPVSTKPSEELF